MVGYKGKGYKYNEEIAQMFCDVLCYCKTVKQACVQFKEQTGTSLVPSTIFKWLLEKPEFLEMYNKANEVRCYTISDELLEIADDAINHVVVDDKGISKVDTGAVTASKLMIDTRLRILGKLQPRIWADKVQEDKIDKTDDLINKMQELINNLPN